MELELVDDVDDDGMLGVENFGTEVGLGEIEFVRLRVSVGVGVGVGVGVAVGVAEDFNVHHPLSPQNPIGVQH